MARDCSVYWAMARDCSVYWAMARDCSVYWATARDCSVYWAMARVCSVYWATARDCSINCMVTPCINNIQHFNFQPMHTTLKNVELLQHFKINKTAPTCFGLQGNHHQGATASTYLELHIWLKVDT